MIDFTIMEVGVPLFIEKELDRKGIKFKSRIVGWVKDSYFLAELPSVNSAYVNWNTGTICVIRFVSKGKAYFFTTTVMKSLHQPIPLLVFSFPKKIDVEVSREYNRIQTYLPCDLYSLTDSLEKRSFDFIGDENFINNAVLLDFSSGGGLVELKNNLVNFYVNEKVGMDMVLPNGEKIEKLVIEIRNIRLENGKKLAGIQFLDANKKPLKKIKQFFDKYGTL